MIRDALTDALRQSLAAIGVDGRPTSSASSSRRGASTATGRRTWRSPSAKAAGRNPRELAQELVDRLDADPPAHVEQVEIAGPGFVNFRLRPTWLHDVLARRRSPPATTASAGSTVGAGTKVNVEFVSANPTGPLHAGHARGAAYGDALARVLERVGHEVSREFYINDRGLQMQQFGESIAARAEGERAARGRATRATTSPTGRARCLGGRRRPRSSGATPAPWPTSGRCSAPLGRHLRHLVLASVSLVRVGRDRADPGRPARARRRLRRRRRGVAALDRLRRRQGPRARQERRRVHLPAARHRLPPRQVRPRLRPAHRRVGRRPPRLRAAHEGRRRGARATRPTSSRSVITQLVRAPHGRPAGQALEAHRRHHRAPRRRSTRSAPTRPASPTCCSRSTRRRPSTSTSIVQQSMDNPVFYVQMAHARLCSIERVAAERGVDRAAARPTSTSRR